MGYPPPPPSPPSAISHSTQVPLRSQDAQSSVCLWMALFTYVPTETMSSSKHILLSAQPKCKSSWYIKSNRIKSKMVAIKKLALEGNKIDIA